MPIASRTRTATAIVLALVVLVGVGVFFATRIFSGDAPVAQREGVTVREGDDWSLPDTAQPAVNSGLFSEELSPDDHVDVRSLDVTWAQLRPTSEPVIDDQRTGSAQGMELAGLADQLAEPGDYWVRLFASGEEWAPAWVIDECQVSTYGPDEDGQRHIPIWNTCVWDRLLETYDLLFNGYGLSKSPQFRFVYVPGAFDWAEYDYDIVTAAVEAGDLSEQEYLDWYSLAWPQLVEVFGDASATLVFTGEDYPWGPFGEADDLLAREAVDAGLGIRNGITELFNFHLSQAPAFGVTLEDDGHMTVDDTLPLHSGEYVVAAENECFTDCGYQTEDVGYAVRQANLKALQLRTNWMYVVPEDSFLDEYPELWNWVRLSLGQSADTSLDAWAALRDAEDTFWTEESGEETWVRNLERFLVQVDEPGSVAHRTDADTHSGEVAEENGTAYEGLSTDVAAGDDGFVFEADERFAAHAVGETVIKVTFLDEGQGDFFVQTSLGDSVAVRRSGSGEWVTATVPLPDGALADQARLRLALDDGADDLVVRFVRVVRLDESAD